MQGSSRREVVIGEPDGPHAGGGEVERRRRSEPAGTDEQHSRVEQPALTLLSDLGDEDLPRVAARLRRAEQAGRRLRRG